MWRILSDLIPVTWPGSPVYPLVLILKHQYFPNINYFKLFAKISTVGHSNHKPSQRMIEGPAKMLETEAIFRPERRQMVD